MKVEELLGNHVEHARSAWRNLWLACAAVVVFVTPTSQSSLLDDVRESAQLIAAYDYSMLAEQDAEFNASVEERLSADDQLRGATAVGTARLVQVPTAGSPLSSVRSFLEQEISGYRLDLSRFESIDKAEAEGECTKLMKSLGVKGESTVALRSLSLLTPASSQTLGYERASEGHSNVALVWDCRSGTVQLSVESPDRVPSVAFNDIGVLVGLEEGRHSDADRRKRVDGVVSPLLPFWDRLERRQLSRIASAADGIAASSSTNTASIAGLTIGRDRGGLFSAVTLLVLSLHFILRQRGLGQAVVARRRAREARSGCLEETWYLLPWSLLSTRKGTRVAAAVVLPAVLILTAVYVPTVQFSRIAGWERIATVIASTLLVVAAVWAAVDSIRLPYPATPRTPDTKPPDR